MRVEPGSVLSHQAGPLPTPIPSHSSGLRPPWPHLAWTRVSPAGHSAASSWVLPLVQAKHASRQGPRPFPAPHLPSAQAPPHKLAQPRGGVRDGAHIGTVAGQDRPPSAWRRWIQPCLMPATPRFSHRTNRSPNGRRHAPTRLSSKGPNAQQTLDNDGGEAGRRPVLSLPCPAEATSERGRQEPRPPSLLDPSPASTCSPPPRALSRE